MNDHQENPMGAKVVADYGEEDGQSEYPNRTLHDARAIAVMLIAAAVAEKRYAKITVYDTYNGLKAFEAENARLASVSDDLERVKGDLQAECSRLFGENAALRAQVEGLREALGKLVRLANASHPEYAGMYRLREGILANPDAPWLKREIGRCIADALAASPDASAREADVPLRVYQMAYALRTLKAVNAAAEGDMLKGNPITGAHHRAIEAKIAELHAALENDAAPARDEEREAEKAVVEAAVEYVDHANFDNFLAIGRVVKVLRAARGEGKR